MLDFEKEPLALYNPDTAHDLPGYAELQARVHRADVIVLGTPDYHGGISGAMKNFLDHFWHEFAGKLFATIVASHEKGLTVDRPTAHRGPAMLRLDAALWRVAHRRTST